VTLPELVARLEDRAAQAERQQASAPVAAVLRCVLEDLAPIAAGNGAVTTAAVGWRERLWTCPPETLLGVRDVAEALGRPRSWVYRAASSWTYRKGEIPEGETKPERVRLRRVAPLPCQRLDGELVFTAGAVRHWITRQEQPVLAGRPGRRRPRSARPEAAH
jgi:hypothetical protein